MAERHTPSDTSKRIRRSPQERREEIIAAAVCLFAEHGYDRTTTKAIAHKAGIAEGTIYKYFTSKQDLFSSILEGMVVAPLTQIFTDLDHMDDEQIIRRLLEDRFARFEENNYIIRVLFGTALFDKSLAAMVGEKILLPAMELGSGYIAQRIEEGVFRKMDPAIAIRTLIGMVIVHVLFWTILPDAQQHVSRTQLIDELTQLFLHGALQQPSREVSA